jgi:predicted nucleic acid-binding protein
MNAIDTNVFVYAFDASEPTKQQRARDFFDHVVASSAPTVIRWQVAVELLARFRKWEAGGVMLHDDVRVRFERFLDTWNIVPPTIRILAASFQLKDNYSLSHWDSLLIAACLEAGVTRLYTEDMQSGANYGGVEIVNPFV